MPPTNNAARNTGKLPVLAEGTKSIIPNAIISNENTMLSLYPIFFITHPAGVPKTTNAEKMAAVTR
ncbi:hypothetical protein SDC9_191802 [bioreactor metagenome]|uniref:Uncharacterized protein n=1 Tax=bioreactor metagenome TaxID=1076179 RepID=A0A645HZA0_9ZZZZ